MVRICVALFLGWIFACTATAAERESDPLIAILNNELQREMQQLRREAIPAYYLSYRVNDVAKLEIRSSFGVLVRSDDTRKKTLSISVRVGDYKLDNTHEMRGDYDYDAYSDSQETVVELPLNNDAQVLQGLLWWKTNELYRQAVRLYTKIKTNVAIKVEAEDKASDFSKETIPVPLAQAEADEPDWTTLRRSWEKRVKNYSRPFLQGHRIFGGEATFSLIRVRNTFVSSEGTRLAWNEQGTRLFLKAFSKADDGMELPSYRSYFSFSPSGLPDATTILREVTNLVALLEKMRNAPPVDPFLGPAILSGRAAGVIFHEILGHRLEGHRQKSEEEGQTFKNMVGKRILPPDFHVFADPLRKRSTNSDLAGFYLFDDEGMPGISVPLVEDGILKGFMMSRSPIENFPHSNGHGRAEVGYRPVARQSNLIVSSAHPLSEAQLRERLLQACKQAGKTSCLRFDDIAGGFTVTGRYLANSVNLIPTEVYRVFTDGRNDELVRGVDLIGTPLTSITSIEAAGSDIGIFNGHCGAESGAVPVAAVAPSILIGQVEVQKKSKSQERPPLLPRPDEVNDGNPLF
ncbi:MAG: hypothetical protein A2284_08740 [Deltaproteobacteria bacterium RIFOXYA12_FULL_61_11]|nr:MAG: hypothetical protein A2284_08740 [Deltaproteobacteria bacterium RIFOXYA12_FULL_61_11]